MASQASAMLNVLGAGLIRGRRPCLQGWIVMNARHCAIEFASLSEKLTRAEVSESRLRRAVEAFIPVMIDVDDPNAAATLSRYGVGATPTTIITDSKGNVLQYEQGRISKADFLKLLGKVDSSAVKNLQN